MLPYGRQSIDDSDIQAVLDVLQGDWLTTGPKVGEFEDAISALAGGYRAVTCTSGTAALHMAYAGAGLGPGDQVVTTPMTFVATASAASMLGAEVVFADVDPETGLIDPDAIADVVSSRTKVIAAVDFAGHPCDYDAIQEVADRVGALTLDDAAHSIGGTYKGRPVGDLADLTTFSFFPTKNLTTGEGGAVVSKDAIRAQRIREFHFIGLVRDPARFEITDEGPWHQEVHEFGTNYRLPDLACALGLSQLRRLGSFKEKRTAIWQRYTEALSGVDGIRVPVVRGDVDPVWHLYPVRVLNGRRREVFEKMSSNGIGVQVNYVPVYWHPAYARLGYQRGACPNAEQFYSQELSLPIFPGLRDDEVDLVIAALIEALR